MRFANKISQLYPKYKIGDKMYVDARHCASERDKKLLDLKNTELWKIVQNINNKAYKLAIPEILKATGLTPIFHLWKIHLAPNNLFPEQILSSNPLIKISVMSLKSTILSLGSQLADQTNGCLLTLLASIASHCYRVWLTTSAALVTWLSTKAIFIFQSSFFLLFLSLYLGTS